MAQRTERLPSDSFASTAKLPLLCCAIALALRWHSIRAFGVDTPLVDQWDHEILGLFRTYLRGELSWRDLVLPANEHRILFTRLMNLGLFIIGGETNNNLAIMYLQAVVSVVPLFATLYLLRREDEGTRLVSLLAAVLFGVCFASENLFWGYQSQVYFALALTSLALGLASREDMPSVRIALCILVHGANMASAMFSGAAAGLLAAWRGWTQKSGAHVLKAILFFAAGAITSTWIWHNPGHEVLKARNLHELMHTLAMYAQWPSDQWAPGGRAWISAWPVWLGAAAYGVQHLFRRHETTRFERFAVLWTAWTFMAIVAGSYARSNSLPIRYYDYLVALMVVLLCAAYLQWRRAQRPALAAAWGMTATCALAGFAIASRPELHAIKLQRAHAQALLIESLAADNGLAEVESIMSQDALVVYPRVERLHQIVALPETKYMLRHLTAAAPGAQTAPAQAPAP